MESIQLSIKGMKCGGCVSTVEKILNNTNGIENVSVNLLTESAYFEINKKHIEIETILENLKDNGFPSKIYINDFSKKINKAELEKKKKWNNQWNKLTFALLLLLFSGLGHLAEGSYINLPILGNIFFHALLATLALLFPGRGIIINGFKSFIKNRPDMDSLVALGVTSAYITSLLSLIFPATGFPCFFNEPVMLLGFIMIGRFLEERARFQTGSSVVDLLDLQPEMANIYKENNQIKSIRINALKPEQEIQVLAGDRVPADCIVTLGTSYVDVSHITGESKPIEVKEGEYLSSGSLNLNSTLRLKVKKVGGDSSLAKLVSLIESVNAKKPRIQRIADEIAGKFTYFVLIFATGTFFFWWKGARNIWPELLSHNHHEFISKSSHTLHNSLGSNADNFLSLAIQLSIAVLVIACPCALGLATPTVITVASGKAAKKGVLFKGGDKIEIASKINHIIFDKTGTLTKGEPFIVDYKNNNDHSFLLRIAASLEKESRHPIANALIQEAKKQNLSLFPIKKIFTHSGRGVSGELDSIDGLINIGNIEWLLSKGTIIDGDAKEVIENEDTKTNTVIGVSIKDKLLGFILLGDLLRDDAIKTVQNLRENKFKINILSGDRKHTVLALAKKIGCKESEVKWDLLPQMKLKTIESFKINNKVAMIGDGINDVPALASSDLGIAVGSGTQIAKANADVVLMGDQLNGLPYALNLAKKTIRKIKQNLIWAFGYNLIAIPLAAGILFPQYGILLTPSIAALLMATSSITVVINALSLE
ncbi:heavy metal translocating P-type ATPase [Prochlorococcus marinus str. MU1404]|uniref:heavy metal translocating P-type ATPase n=1 Tax=Prochlorococcus marinus TaxID=1219 RepID=UPI001ADCC354|nr:cation-translocating P-type ATPase [Prochlorococcus marinus]MBO8229301.1 cation-translocating P-type ATPase [Prochlorococcus marinus XMU1404]MBW3072384.1 heavy metal translocating P-type ATPase [Prochlorococcus marinus str. MU1404]MCR8544515.1 cation-translocating P-type ATPase [Prochlorococcus marinus CUG1432]